MSLLVRRILLAAVAAGAATLVGAAPALAATLAPNASPVDVSPAQPGDDDDDDDDDRGRAPAGGVQAGTGGFVTQPGDDDDDDDGGAPTGGVDAGAGGMAGHPDLTLPLGAAGAVALMGGAVFLRRSLGDHNG